MSSPMPFLVFVAMGSPIALNALLPALPTLAESFGVSHNHIQLNISLYLAALALGQLAVGGIISALGIRRTTLLGLTLFISGSLLGAAHPSLEAILLGRILQGLGGAIMMSISRALLVANYGSKKAPQKMGYIIMAIAISQSIAPLLGSYLDTWLGWWCIFLFSALQGAIIFIASFHYVKDQEDAPQRPSFSGTLQLYYNLLKEKGFRIYAGSNTLIACCFYLFVGAAPYLTSHLTDQSGSAGHAFGYWFISISIAFMLGGYLSTLLNEKFSVDQTIMIGNGLSLLGAIGLLLLLTLLPISFATLFIPMCFVTLGRGISQPSCQSAGLSLISTQSGMAAGLMGFLQLASGSLVSQITPTLIGIEPLLLPIVITLFVVLAGGSHLMFKKAN